MTGEIQPIGQFENPGPTPEELANTPRRRVIADGDVVTALDGVQYRVSNLTGNTLTFTRAIPKVRGKAARKALKRQRHQVRL